MKISLEKDSAALLTKRLEKQSLISFFSNLAGSILGILGAVGYAMNTIEERYEKFRRKPARKCRLNEIMGNRIHLQGSNLVDIKEIDAISFLKPEENLGNKTSFQDSQYSEICMNNPENSLSEIDHRISYKRNMIVPLDI